MHGYWHNCSQITRPRRKRSPQFDQQVPVGFLTKPYTSEELDDVLTLVRDMAVVMDAPLASNEDTEGATEIEISPLQG